jgi:hypothetical protein
MKRFFLILVTLLFLQVAGRGQAQAQTQEFRTTFREVVAEVQRGNGQYVTATQLPGEVIKSSLAKSNSQDNSVAERIDMIYQVVYMHHQNSKSYAEFGAMVSQERGLYHLEMVYTNKDKTSYMVYSAQHGDKREFLVMITTPTYRGCVIDIVGSLSLQDVMTMAEISGVPTIPSIK